MVLIGRAYVKMGRTTSLSNNIYLDIARGHVVYITGKRGSGKCLLGDTLITLDDGRQVPIKDLEYTDGDILALNDKLKVISTKREGFYKRKVSRILEIELRSGKKIKLTPEHPLLTISGWKEAQELPISERIATPKKSESHILQETEKEQFADFVIENYAQSKIECYPYVTQMQSITKEQVFEIIDSSDIFWDQIIAIEERTGEFEVYDITVPELHNFVANDIIVHNSYTMGAIAEGVMDLPDDVRKNLSMIMFDTMGVYWTMKYPNQKDEDLLEQWGMKGRGMDVKIYTPFGFFQKYRDDGIPTDYPFSIKASDLTSQDWILSFELKESNPVAVVIEKTIGDFIELEKKNYDINDLIDYIKNDNSFSLDIKNEAINRFRTAERWGLFSDEGMNLMDLVKPGEITVMDLSPYVAAEGGWGVKALVIGLIGMRVFSQRMLARKAEELESINVGYSYFQVEEEVGKKESLPIVWLVVDECLPKDSIVITSKNHTPIGDIYERFMNGEKFQVLGYDTMNGSYGHYDVTKVWKKPASHIISLQTETGRILKCTPEHKIFSKSGFLEAINCEEVAIPLIQHYSEKSELIKARLLGHIFGDGWVSAKTKSVGFTGKGNKKDLEHIKKDLQTLGFSSSNIHTRVTHSQITANSGKVVYVNGLTQSIHASTRAYNYFSKLDTPIGEKVLAKYSVPKWLIEATNAEKKEFLAALMGSDGVAPSPCKKVPSDFNPIRISFNKIEELEESAIQFANDLKQLFEDLGVKVSKISREEGNLRKDGKKTFKIVLTLAKNTENTIRFLEQIGYRYCLKKEIIANQWICYFNARKNVILSREKQKQKALELKKQGLGKIRIARQIGVKVFEAREWIYTKSKVGVPKTFPSFQEWVSKRQNGNILFEKIESKTELEPEELYDISVDKVHNFVANGCIVHNCHEFLPKEGKTAATDALVIIMREGRQPGVSLIMATQQPGKIHTDVMSQSDIVISHRLTAKPDVDALSTMSQSYMTKSLPRMLDELPRVKGCALILDDSSERFYEMQVRPRLTWHGGAAPTAIKYKRKLELGL